MDDAEPEELSSLEQGVPRVEPLSETQSSVLWSDEIGFSNWLHRNIAVLGSALTIPLISLQREARVGRLSADLLAGIEGTDERVIIENQIYPANHGHFGQTLTYAAHYDARVIIWVATRFRDEYRNAIAWLNTLCDKRFFAVELRASPGLPPSFEIVAGPESVFRGGAHVPGAAIVPTSPDSRSAQSGAYVPSPFAIPADRSASPGQLVLNNIFEMMAEILQGSPEFPRLRKPTGDRNYYVVAVGPVPKSEWAVTFENSQVGVGLVFTNAATAVRDLVNVGRHATEIDAAVGYEIDFRTVAGRDKQKAILYRPLSYEQRSQEAEEIARWCVETITAFAREVRRLAVFA